MTSNLKKTPLFDFHQQANAKMVDFGGWDLPINYGSQIEEHHCVRKNAGMFDVSHMRVWDIHGKGSIDFLSYLLANDIEKSTQHPGKAMYSCMLNQDGGVIDDLIVYYLTNEHCRIVSNASTYQKMATWLYDKATSFEVSIEEKPDLAIVAVQGPNAVALCQQHLASAIKETLGNLKPFHGQWFDLDNNQSKHQFVGRTGYTGEDGIEFIVNKKVAQYIWQTLSDAGIPPCGLAARDTLRLESGMALYGNDLDEQHTPLESGLTWTVKASDEREFIGKTALSQAQKYKKINLVLLDRGVLRAQQAVFHQQQKIGEITSGSFAPTLDASIAMARIENHHPLHIGDIIQVEIRNRRLDAKLVKNPFVKKGQYNL